MLRTLHHPLPPQNERSQTKRRKSQNHGERERELGITTADHHRRRNAGWHPFMLWFGQATFKLVGFHTVRICTVL